MNPSLKQEINLKLLKQTQELRDGHFNFFTQESDEIESVYSLYFEPDSESKEIIQKIQADLKEIQSNHLYYEPYQLHMTLVGGIQSTKEVTRVLELLREYFSEPPEIELYGINGNPSALNVIGYPKNFSYSEVRNAIREHISDEGVDYTNWVQHIGWINFLRYQTAPSKALIDYLEANYKKAYTAMRPAKIVLVENATKTMSKDTTRLVDEITF